MDLPVHDEILWHACVKANAALGGDAASDPRLAFPYLVRGSWMNDMNQVSPLLDAAGNVLRTTITPADLQVAILLCHYEPGTEGLAHPDAPKDLIEKFRTLLLAMSYADAEVRPLLDLEGLKAWKPARTSGYRALEKAVDITQFYDATGNIRVADYRY